MKCLLIYYSLTGSTERIADRISLGLKQAGLEVSRCNIRNDSPPDLAGYDLIGLGTPVYYFSIPINVLECIESLSIPAGVDVFAFMTNGSYAWNAADVMEAALLQQGVRVSGWFSSLGAGYFFGYNKLGCLASPKSPTGDDLARAETFGYEMASASRAANWPKRIQAPSMVYRLEQRLTQRSLIRGVFQKLFYLDKQKCIKCGLCVKGCPTGNLERTSEGFPHWNRSCIMCLACEANCPKQAIRSPVSWPIMKPLIRYNVNRILQDPNLEKAKVRHQNGKLELIE